MKQFLRFQISGLTSLLWFLLFFYPYVDLADSGISTSKGVIAFCLSFVTLALPLGTIVHQISITLFSPFRKNRFFILKRKALCEINDFKPFRMQDAHKLKQYKLALIKGTKVCHKISNKEVSLDTSAISKEISNRYSYYYLRVDNGIVAPSIGFIIFFYFKSISLAHDCTFLREPAGDYLCSILFVVFLYVILMMWHVPTILSEIDDLERTMIRFYKKNFPSLFSNC
ncbi:hypothetical protein [Desulfobaculum senezii]